MFVVFSRQAQVRTRCTQTHMLHTPTTVKTHGFHVTCFQKESQRKRCMQRGFQRTQQLYFCHGSQSCAWGGHRMNQFQRTDCGMMAAANHLTSETYHEDMPSHTQGGLGGRKQNLSHCEPSDSDVQPCVMLFKSQHIGTDVEKATCMKRNVKTQVMHEKAVIEKQVNMCAKDMRVQDCSSSCFANERRTEKTAQFSFWKIATKHTQNKVLSITMERCLILLGLWVSHVKLRFEHAALKLTCCTLQQLSKLMDSMSHVSRKRIATKTLQAERLPADATAFFLSWQPKLCMGWSKNESVWRYDGCSEPSDV